MKIQIIYAHPVEGSFGDAVHRSVIEGLGHGGHDVVDTDLYREGFQPAMTRAERIAYHVPGRNTATVQEYVNRLLWAEALVFCFPTWWHGPPAILKGYLERVMVPGVAFHLPADGGGLRPGLTHIRKLGVVTTCGAPWWHEALYMRHPGKSALLRGLKPHLARDARHVFLAHYGMDRSTPASRAKFLTKVHQAFRGF